MCLLLVTNTQNKYSTAKLKGLFCDVITSIALTTFKNKRSNNKRLNEDKAREMYCVKGHFQVSRVKFVSCTLSHCALVLFVDWLEYGLFSDIKILSLSCHLQKMCLKRSAHVVWTSVKLTVVTRMENWTPVSSLVEDDRYGLNLIYFTINMILSRSLPV